MNAPLVNAAPPGDVEAHTLRRPAGAFATPWHVCVHGLGLDTGAVSTPLAPLVRLSALLVERSHPEPFAAVAHELLQLLSSHYEPVGKSQTLAASMQRVSDLLAGITDTETRAIAEAAALHVLAHFGGTADSVIRGFVRSTLADLLGARPTEPRQRYQALCASVQLLHAAQGAASTASAGEELTLQLDEVLARSLRLEQPFHAKRITAVLLAVRARGEAQRPSAAWLDHLTRLLADCTAIHGPLPQDDEIHCGLDFITFPLALALEAAAQTAQGRRLAVNGGAVYAALYLLEQLPPASKVSQLAFLVEPLLALDAMPSARLQERACSALRDYLDNSTGSDADAYLRSTYAIYAAARLGSADQLPREVFMRIEQALLVRGRPVSGYFSLPMVAAYALYSSCVAPAAQRALPDPEALADVLASRLPNQAVPASAARKLSHALLYLGLTRHARRLERSYFNTVLEVAV